MPKQKLTYEELEQENQTLKEMLAYCAPFAGLQACIAEEIGEAERVAKKLLAEFGSIKP